MRLPHLWQPNAHHDMSTALTDWFNTELGRELLVAENRLLGHILPDLFGYHALQLGQIVACNLLHSSRIHHRIVCDKQLTAVEGLSPLHALPTQLPLASGSLDLVVVHHVLDVVVSPHAVLREATRVLIPEGHLVILGFNPWSLWGLWRFCRLPWSNTPWLQRYVSPQRLADWLALLNFEVIGLETVYFKPPIITPALRQRFTWLELLGSRYWSHGGASYALLAKKQIACVTPLRVKQPLIQILQPPLITETRGQQKTVDK
ncbi:methyltransferase domain-containing protein [Agitococcus lubricus]|uniref:Methyltransferase family protein n=1 Tax=Agitococcus lubricus TaxID=1077255 RepID=A0A2T5J1M9_9GAMM|nr:methyltransferase domain-containing protein [Agitococcus lubricus]PTQ90337.1 methyltransferase family protein [Agitococcus lubricus]